MNTDQELVEWLDARVYEVNRAVERPNLEDKLNALQMLRETTERIFAVVEAQMAISDKPYAAKYIAPWKVSKS